MSATPTAQTFPGSGGGTGGKKAVHVKVSSPVVFAFCVGNFATQSSAIKVI